MVFKYEDLQKATDNFNDANLIGKGEFGSVYKGRLHFSNVAVKVLSDVRNGGLHRTHTLKFLI